MADCEALRLHYVYTLRAWYERLKAQRGRDRPAATTSASTGSGSSTSPPRSTMFSDGGMIVYQLQYLKRRNSTPIARDYMFEEEKRLRAA